MRLCSSFVILIVCISCTASHDSDVGNQTEHGPSGRREMVPGETTTETLGQGRELAQGRTFAIKRLQFMLLPVMYKMGVMTTLLVVLVVVALKSLLIGVILLVLKVGSIFAKFHQPYHQVQAAPVIHEPAWLPPQPQPVHVHMHYDGPPTHDHYDRQGQIQDQVYSGWDRSPPSAPAPYAQTLAINSQGQYVYRG